MKWKQLLRKLSGDRGYYLALAVCAAAVAVSGWLFVRSLRTEEPEAQLPDAVQAAVLPTLPRIDGNKLPDSDRPIVSVKPNRPVTPVAPETEAPTEPAPKPEKPVDRPAAIRFRPVEGGVVQGYSMDKLSFNPTTRDWRTHAGMDLSAPEGSEVRAVAEGTVLSVFDDDLLGRTVTIQHEDGFVTHYANLAEEVAVSAGDRVEAGQTIGAVGKTALGEIGCEPHLHFAVYRNNVPQDPEAFLGG